MIREALAELDSKFSRRALFHTLFKGAGLVAALDHYGPSLFAATEARIPYLVYAAIGDIVIPVDEDPGWATFEPAITPYGVDVYVRNVLLGGNFLAFVGYLATLTALNQLPVLAKYGPTFLQMTSVAKSQFFSDVLVGRFENDGFGDVAGFSAGLSLLSTRSVFFSNFPNHLAYPNEEYQVRKPIGVRTGWDIMQLRGPVGPDEEKQLRAQYFDSEELPGVDPDNQYI